MSFFVIVSVVGSSYFLLSAISFPG